MLFSLNQSLNLQADRSSARRKSVWGDRKDDLFTLTKLSSVLCQIKEGKCSDKFVKEQGDMLVDAVLLILNSLKDHFSRLVSPATVRRFSSAFYYFNIQLDDESVQVEILSLEFCIKSLAVIIQQPTSIKCHSFIILR